MHKVVQIVVKAFVDVVTMPALTHNVSNLLIPCGKVLLVDRQYKYDTSLTR